MREDETLVKKSEIAVEKDSLGRLKKTKDESGLTAGERRFCEAFVSNGGNKLTAVKEAGYTSKHPLNVASKLLHRDRVIEEINRLTKKRLALSSTQAVHVVEGLMTSARSEYVKLQSAVTVLDRTGHKDSVISSPSSAIQINIDLS